MTCKARSQAWASDSPRLNRDTVHVAPLISPSRPTTTTLRASSQSAKRRSSVVSKSWISTLVFGSLLTICLWASASIWCDARPLRPLQLAFLDDTLMQLARALDAVLIVAVTLGKLANDLVRALRRIAIGKAAT